MKMIKMLTLAALSSVYVMQGACVLNPDGGYSIIPTIHLSDLLAGIPIIGT